MNIVSRDNVIWFGEKPKGQRILEFERRNLTIKYSSELINDELQTTRGIVFRYNKFKHNRYRLLLEDILHAIDYGIFIYIYADDDESVARISQILNKIINIDDIAKITVPLTTRVSPPLFEIAETIARHDPGPAPNLALKIEPPLSPYLVDMNAELFLKRCFHDCNSILMQPLVEGRTNAQVFSVHAVFSDALAGPRPLPFFVKIDTKHKIKRELNNYEHYTAHFIPFNLRPNIEKSRCIIGNTKGMLVGNFVEQSESLWDVIRRGNAQQVIYSLFDNALRGWRMQRKNYKDSFAYAMSAKPQHNIGDFFDPSMVSQERIKKTKELGAKKTPHELKEILLSLPDIMISHSPIHADLHAHNVRVRGNDPILIDFASTRIGPMLADPASLEISLAFEIADNDDIDDKGWSSLMDILYDYDFLGKTPEPPLEPRPREWLWTSIRQIRLIALADQISPHEYRLSLITFLLRRSMYKKDSENENYRLAYAYCLAEKLLLKIQKKIKRKKHESK